jgi:MarR family transcriptional regulator, organic hydroperoxide resistance regulator
MTHRAWRALEPPLPPLGEVLDFMRLIWAVDHALQKASKKMRSTLGVTGPQRLVIRIVSRFPGLPAGRIAELLHVHPSTLTGVLKRLERQGLIRRRSDPKDGRRILVGITEKGRWIDAAASGTVEAAVQKVLRDASARQIDDARVVLAMIAEALGAEE